MCVCVCVCGGGGGGCSIRVQYFDPQITERFLYLQKPHKVNRCGPCSGLTGSMRMTGHWSHTKMIARIYSFTLFFDVRQNDSYSVT